MNKEALSWGKAGVFFCTKCGKSIPGAPENLAEALKNELKAELKALNLAKDIRVMTSSCLDICQAGFQAVAIFPKDQMEMASVRVFDPLTEKLEIQREILKLKDLLKTV